MSEAQQGEGAVAIEVREVARRSRRWALEVECRMWLTPASLAAPLGHSHRHLGGLEVRIAAADSGEVGSEEEVAGDEAWLADDGRRAASGWVRPWASFGLSVRQPSRVSWSRQSRRSWYYWEFDSRIVKARGGVVASVVLRVLSMLSSVGWSLGFVLYRIVGSSTEAETRVK